MSLQLVLAALYPPKETSLEWNKNLNWQPTPLQYEPLLEDSLILVTKVCPRYDEELKRVLENDVKHEIDEYDWLFRDLSNLTGRSIRTPRDIQSLHGVLKAEAS